MLAGERTSDPVFHPKEKLFRRYLAVHFDGMNFSGVGVSLKNPISVNRQKYSVPEDVLFDENNAFVEYGVLSFRVQHITKSFPADQPEVGLLVRHTPLQINYAHSDIVCNDLVNAEKHVEPDRRLRKLLRTELGRAAVVELPAATT